MKSGTLILSILFLFSLSLSAFSQSEKVSMNAVQNFFGGTWKVEGRETYERWEVSGESLVGRGYKIKDGAEKLSENLEIKCIEGKIYYLATVPDQNDGKTVRFALTSSSESEFTFENPEHDFPKKLIYKKNSPTEMFVQVLGEGGKGFSFKMIKINK